MNAPDGVAVIVPTYNRAAYLRLALESVLKQTRPADEVVVVDDGSTDDTPGVCAEFPGITYLRQENQRQAAARNLGIRSTTAPFLCFLDDDDLLTPDALAERLDAFRRWPRTGLVYTRQLRIDPEGKTIGENLVGHRHPKDVLHSLLHDCFVRIQTVMVRREAVEAAGGFDPGLALCEDYDLWLRLALQGCRFAYVDRATAAYRVHPHSAARQHAAMVSAHLGVLLRNAPRVPRRYAAPLHYVIGRAYLAAEQEAMAARPLLRAACAAPWRLRYWAYYAMAVCPGFRAPGQRLMRAAHTVLVATGARRPD